MYYFIPDTPYRNIFYHKYLIKLFDKEYNWIKINSKDELNNIDKSKIYSTIDSFSVIKNEIKPFWEICHKANMASILQKSPYIPPTYIIHNLKISDEICSINNKLEVEDNLYFLKKNNSGRGKDIFILNKLEDYKPYLEKFRNNLIKNIKCTNMNISKLKEYLSNVNYHLNDKWILQKAIKPALFDGKKFTIRQFFMIQRRNNKLISYLYNDFYIVKLSNDYNSSTNKNVQMTGPGGGKSFRIDSNDWVYNKEYCIKAFNMMKDISPSLLGIFNKQGCNCYQLFGLDTILDKNLNVSLIEINYGAGFTDCRYKLNIKMIRDLVNLIILPEVGIECKIKTGWQKLYEL